MSNTDRILLIGAGGHARSCIDVIEQADIAIGGLLGQAHEVGTTVLGYPVLKTDVEMASLAGEMLRALICVGQIESPETRMRLYAAMRAAGFAAPPIVSPLAHVSRHARIGDGSIIMHGAIVNAGAVIGENCIINSQALIEHDSSVGDHCHISTRAVLNGDVHVGARCFVGSGTVIRHGARIGNDCFVGMGSLVLADCPDNTRVVGKA